MELKPGYTQTEVGVIPEEWGRGKLEEYFSFISYGFTNPMPIVEHGIYLITAADVSEGGIQFDTARHTTEVAYQTLLTPKSKPKKDDILLTKDGSLGRLALVGNEVICINQSVAVIRPNEKVEPVFLKLLLESPGYQKKMLEDAGGSTIKHIYISIVNLMLITVPKSRAEQRAIAAALNDVDALIGALDQLIAKKRDLKEAAMQQLLTGKRRLPSFCGEWEAKRLGEIADIQRGASPRPIDSPVWYDSRSAVGWVRISDIAESDGRTLLKTQDYLSQKGIAASRFLPSGSLIMSICATVGRPVITGFDTCIHDGFVGFSNLRRVDKRFLFYKLAQLESNFKAMGQTGSQANLNTDLVKNFEIELPKPSEQTAIAAVLSDMDAEIAALEARRDKTRALKQGMMQELLTGRVRLL